MVTSEYAIEDFKNAADGALDGETIRPFTPKERAPEWGKRALIVGASPATPEWIRDLGRRAVVVDLVPNRLSLDAASIVRSVLGARADIVIVVGDCGPEVLAAIHQEAPEVALVLAKDQPQEGPIPRKRVYECVATDAGPRTLITAIRLAMEASNARQAIAALEAKVARMKAELDRFREDAQRSLTQRHRSVCDTKRAWEKTFDAVTTPLAVIDRKFVVINANRAYAKQANEDVTAVPGRFCHEVLFGRKSACAGCPQRTGKDRGEVEDKSGRKFEVTSTLVDAESEAFVCTYRDLTEQQREFEERVRTERMSALGEMSAGLAHELNNPIAGILAMAQALGRDPVILQSPDLALDMADIEEGARRSKAILQALLRYARGGGSQDQGVIDIAQAISDAFIVVNAELRAAEVAVDVTAEPGATEAMGSGGAFQEAMVHLLRNAADAVTVNRETKIQPKITIRTLNQGDEIWVEVADNGRGLPTTMDTRSLLIPFVSDSGRALGKGLGLALVSRLIEDGMGKVELVRQQGGGATVRLRLRAVSPKSVDS